MIEVERQNCKRATGLENLVCSGKFNCFNLFSLDTSKLLNASECSCFQTLEMELCDPYEEHQTESKLFVKSLEKVCVTWPDISEESSVSFNSSNSLFNSHIYFKLASSYQEKGDLRRAIQNYELCLEADQHHHEAQLNMEYCNKKCDESTKKFNSGHLSFSQGDIQTAIDFFIEALELDPSNVKAWISLGLMYHSMNKLESVLECNQQAISFEPSNEIAHYNLGCCFLDMGNLEEAIQMYKSVLNINAANKDAFYYLGVAYQKLGQEEKAVECFTHALLIEPFF